MSDLITRAEHSTEAGREPLRIQPYFNQTPKDEFTISEFYTFLLNLIVRRKFLILGITSAITAITAVQLFTMSPLYRASTTIQIDTDAPTTFLPGDLFGTLAGNFREREAYLQTQKEILEGESMAQRVANALDLRNSIPFNESPKSGFFLEQISDLKTTLRGVFTADTGETSEAGPKSDFLIRQHLLSDLDVNLLPGTNLCEISFSSHDPELAMQIVNSYSTQLIGFNLALSQEKTITARDFLRVNMERARSALEKSEAELVEYARNRNILRFDPTQEVMLKKMMDLDHELTLVESRLLAVDAQRRSLSLADFSDFPPSLENAAILELESRLGQLNQRSRSLMVEYGRSWPERVQLEQEIKEVERQLELEKSKAIERAQLEYDIAEQHYKLSLQRLMAQKNSLSQLSEDLVPYTLLEREVESNKLLYQDLLQRFKQASVSSEASVSNIKVVEPGRNPENPYFPEKIPYLAVSVLVGLLLGFGVAVVSETLDDSVRSGAELERELGIPCLTVIPQFSTPPALRVKEASEVSEGVPMVRERNDSSGLGAFRLLRTSLLSRSTSGFGKSILVTSSLESEGKTTTAVNLAISLAGTGSRILLVDSNLWRPRIAEMFGLDPAMGLGRFLAGETTLHSQLCRTHIENLVVLPAGPRPSNSSDRISSPRMEKTLRLLEEFFDFVVMDGPSILTETDALALSSKVREVLFVARASMTPRSAVMSSLNHLQRVHANVIGSVVNGVDTKVAGNGWAYRS